MTHEADNSENGYNTTDISPWDRLEPQSGLWEAKYMRNYSQLTRNTTYKNFLCTSEEAITLYESRIS